MTVTVAANPAAPCPSGRLVSNGAATKDGLVLNVVTIPTAAYGALNGDGRPEAVIAAGCFRSDTGDATETEQLLVVSRATDGTLAGTWAGAVGPAVVRVRAR